MTIIVEQWKPVLGYEGLYEVSDQGRVRSLHCRLWSGSHWYTCPSRIMKTPVAKNGYPVVKLTKDGLGKTVTVHKVVLSAFVGPKPPGQECRHLNGDCKDFRLANLEWGTPAENTEDRKAHGTMPCGVTHHGAKLTEQDIRSIRASDELVRVLAKRYGVTTAAISNVRTRRSWAHVP
jgi:hypothetical protein